MAQIQSSMVSVPRPHDKGMMESFLARPAGGRPVPGLVLIHEVAGLNEHIRDIARQFAELGYAVLAVDLFSNRNRVICMLQVFYGILLRPLANSTLSELSSAMTFLRAQKNVDANRIGALGFCMGGSYALQLAVTEKGMKAASVFYGANPRPLESVAQACPIVGSYPDKDFTTRHARELEDALTSNSIPHDIKIYENTQHSFFSQRRTPAEVEAAEDAWRRMVAFFGEHLS